MPDHVLVRAISKSRYMSGLQCHKLLWHQYHAKDLIPPYGASQQAIFDMGHEVGRRAHLLYPGGVLIHREDRDLDGLVEDTVAALSACLDTRTPIYEAAFLGAGVYAQIDILVPTLDGRWDIVEVKSATSVKGQYLDDVAVQRYAAEHAGVCIRNCHVAHINGSYVRPAGDADIDSHALFTIEDVTAQVAERLPDLPNRLDVLTSVIEQPASPDVPIGTHCSKPYDCPMISVCWKGMPEENVTRLVGGGKGKFQLVRQGVTKIADIPADFGLNDRQAIQVSAARSRQAQVNGPNVRAFLDTLTYPLFFLDFETFGTAVPLLEGVRPYQQVPFQFSLHIRREPDGPLLHHSFLADDAGDPRPRLLERMQELLEDTGSIVAYFAKFEAGRLQELARAFPDSARWIEAILARVVDLHSPFKCFDVYHPLQNGSTSLKAILPALTGTGYGGMAIADGGTASQTFLRLAFGNQPPDGRLGADEIAAVRRDLEAYCELDTLAMVRILDELARMAHLPQALEN